MKFHALVFTLVALLFSGCQTAPAPVINAQTGDENKKLVEDLNGQIATLKSQVQTLNEKLSEKDKIIGKVAGSATGIDVGVQHIEGESRGKDVVVAENTLIKKATGEPPAEERAAAAERTLAILQGDLKRQQELYGKATAQIDETKKVIAQKDLEISNRDQEIKNRDAALAEQKKKSDQEAVATASKWQGVVNGYENRITTMKNEQAAKERKLWINTLRFGGFGIVLLGVIALAVTSGRALAPGLILIGSGALVILIGVAIDILTSQWWFPYAAGLVGLIFLFGLGWFCWNLFKAHKNGETSVAMLNDMKTEAETLASKGDAEAKSLLDQIKSHAEYRFGDVKKLESLFVKGGLDAKS
jgi:predicted  nucleic acid-binding Zn-ribbon protein